MSRHRRVAARIALVVLLAGGTRASWLLACSFLEDLRTVQAIAPPHLTEYGGGELGVVRPHFARRFLIQAYRSYSGRPPLDDTVRHPWEAVASRDFHPIEAWTLARQAVLPGTKPPATLGTDRDVGNYQYIDNCQSDAFRNAVRTLNERIAASSRTSVEVVDWVRAQDAVFANCGSGPLVLPQPAPDSASALARADRAYQTAAAHFYATEYLEAGRRFRAIADDTASPWRPYGRYLAARSLIRQGTVHEKDAAAAERLAEAAAALNEVLNDPVAKPVHASARGLLDFVAGRARPIERIRQLSRSILADRDVPLQDLVDYQFLMDRLVGDTTVLEYASMVNRDGLAGTGDLTDWILTMQGTGETAMTHAVERWKATRATPWLVAALWKIHPSHPDAPSALTAAQAFDRSSAVFPTLAFLRVRLLARRGATDEARRLLATLPLAPERGFPVETINLYAAERFMLASSLEELLASAPRTYVPVTGGGDLGFDADASLVFSSRLPLRRLIDASLTTTLPAAVRIRMAKAAFTRTLLLRRYDDSRRLVPVLEKMAPSMRADLARFAAAPNDADRHLAAVLMLLRTPGLDMDVAGLDGRSSDGIERELNHSFRYNWWAENRPERETSPLMDLLYAAAGPPYPSFLTAAERAATENEQAALNAIGPAPNYLATEAVTWALARPSDPDAAEALALAVEGTRWGRGNEKTTNFSRRAFQTLHKLFPKSEWARKTKYWY